MAERSKIEWTDHTFNPWIGCTPVSAACDHCYAEALSDRYGWAEWGPHGERRRTAPSTWARPIAWQRRAAAFAAEHGRRQRVFCASLADVFDNQVPPSWRLALFDIVRATPDLDWLLLSKRPQNFSRMLPVDWGERGWPNVWLGVSAEDQASADQRIPPLLATPAAVRFVSYEPALGPVDFTPWLPGCHECAEECGWRSGKPPEKEKCQWCGALSGSFGEFCSACGRQDFTGVCPRCDANVVHQHPDTPHLDWIICGGESGPGARPMHPDWARAARDQCAAAGVACFFKQWGEWHPDPPISTFSNVAHVWADGRSCAYRDLGKPPYTRRAGDGHMTTARVGKARAGRLLDGVLHDAFPEVVHDR